MRLFYVPVERYRERWTEFVSGPNGIFERQARELGVDIVPIRPHDKVLTINSGQVLDPVSRCAWAFEQTQQLVQMLTSGFIDPHDVVYFEDFWHPGMEMIPYAMNLAKRDQVKLYAFNHAQSIDPYDFTASMSPWMRGFEVAWSGVLDGVFCAAEELQVSMKHEWYDEVSAFFSKRNYQATGTVFAHEVLHEIAGVGEMYDPTQSEREQIVIYSSRWDKEKNPDFFCSLAEAVIKERDDVDFVVITGARELKSNSPRLLDLAKSMLAKYGERFFVILGASKKHYYNHLDSAMVQFNCADQDFVSYTLLEAATFGCAPLYPDYHTFPDALHGHAGHLYKKNNLFDAKLKLYALLSAPVRDYSWVYKKYERSVHRMLHHMGFDVPPVPSLGDEIKDGRSQVAKETYQ